MNLRFVAAGVVALGLSAGSALAQNAQANPPQPPPVNKPVLSYAIGYEMGRDLAVQKTEVDVNGVIKGLQDGLERRAPAYPGEQMETQLTGFQMRMMAEAKAEYDKVAAQNKAKSDEFLAANRGKSGITVLPSGIQYRIIEAGTGQRPNANSKVRFHYRLSLSNGREMMNTLAQDPPEPVATVVSTFQIKGVREILPLMPVGSRWEVFLPPDQAFGLSPRPVGPNQAIVLEIRLIGVE